MLNEAGNCAAEHQAQSSAELADAKGLIQLPRVHTNAASEFETMCTKLYNTGMFS